jgi:cell wall assembly regulator SMI1
MEHAIMQKFTRPLTREIELAGERLVLTLSADGISVRPVGARKPPHDMNWAELICCLAGSQTRRASAPGADELNAALDALKKRGPAKPTSEAVPLAHQAAPRPEAPASDDINRLLGRLEEWLKRHRKHFLEGLLPGAAPADVDALAQHLGVSVPASLRALLAWHNGQSPDSRGRFEQDWLLMGTGSIADAKRELDADFRDHGWQPAWVPFLDNDAGDYVCLDTTQSGAPVRQFWQDKTEHPIGAPSLEAWLADVVQAMERGDYHEDPERGSFLRR